MDKDSVILKYEQENVADIEEETARLEERGKSQEEQLETLKTRLDGLYQKAGKKPLKVKVTERLKSLKKEETSEEAVLSYDELFRLAEQSLKERGLSPDELDYSDLVSQEELDEIIEELNRPLPREAKWTKSDFIVVFIAAILGCIVDIVLSNRDNKFTGKDSKFDEWLNKFHKHKKGAPIDYQGDGFTSGFHRVYTRGHDPLRFVEGIQSSKTDNSKV